MRTTQTFCRFTSNTLSPSSTAERMTQTSLCYACAECSWSRANLWGLFGGKDPPVFQPPKNRTGNGTFVGKRDNLDRQDEDGEGHGPSLEHQRTFAGLCSANTSCGKAVSSRRGSGWCPWHRWVHPWRVAALDGASAGVARATAWCTARPCSAISVTPSDSCAAFERHGFFA